MAQPSPSKLRAEVDEVFAVHTSPDSEDLLSECVKLCQIFNITPNDLFYKWEAMTLDFQSAHSSIRKSLDKESLHTLKTSLLQRRTVPKQEKKSIGQPATLAGVMSRGGQRRLPEQPNSSFASLSRPAPIAVKREMDELNFRVPSGSSIVELTRAESKQKNSYRYMYEKPSERSDVLDDRIDDFADIVREHYALSELGDPAAATEEDVVIVGRIVSDTDAPVSVKINDSSVMIESSRMMGSGARVPLRFDPGFKIRRGKDTVGLFPGAIMALKGRNGGGGWFSVTEVLSLPPLRHPPVLVKDPEYANPFTIRIISGPYTSDSDLSYKPWQDVMSTVMKDKPDVLLISGPFIDSLNSRIKNGDIDNTPRDMFRIHFEQPLNNILASCTGLIIIVIPSVQDALSDHAVFPQPELSPQLLQHHRVHFLPNPSRFSLNGVSFAASTVDVLFHLRKEEFLKRGVPIEPSQADDNADDAMVNLIQHLLRQRSLYPIFPVPLDNSQEVNLDLSHSGLLDLEGESEDNAPHVLILPSRLKYFAKIIDGTTAINPSYLSKGTFADVYFSHPEGGEVKDGLRVEIRKLSEVVRD